MRLSDLERKAIAESFNKFSKPFMSLYLFGSRADESKKGGDIDLLIVLSKGELKSEFKRLDFIVELKKKIGERKIDITLASEEELKADTFLASVMDSAVRLV